MERLTDWSALWRELVECGAWGLGGGVGRSDQDDPWASRARDFNECVKKRWSGPDSSRQFVSSCVEPGTTVLDIGAGTGAWSILLSRKAALVTAVDASPAMANVMHENLTAEGITNVDFVAGLWPDVSIGPHDYSLCAHAMYGSRDLPTFVEAMIRATRRTCFLMFRSPVRGGIMAEAALHLWGQPQDSPNFVIGYNVLLQMGLTPNVLMETGPTESGGLWDARTSASMDEALVRMKRHFGQSGSTEHDAYFLELLGRRLKQRDGLYVWERDMRSALVYWNVT